MTGKLFVKFHAEIVNGICPSCEQLTMLVGVTRDQYRCLSCGEDLKQHINQWRTVFNQEHIKVLRDELDEVLEQMGYLKNSPW